MKFLNVFFLRGILAIFLLVGVLSVQAQTTGLTPVQQPGFYRMQLGDYEVIALSDGTVPLNIKSLLHEKKPGEIRELLQRSYLDTIVETSITAYLVISGGHHILIDAGSGSLMGSTLGKLKTNLVAAGFSLDDIDAILITHLHIDHVGGLVDGNKIAFPNATIYISKPEADFWLNAANKATANKRAQPFFDPAQASLLPYQEAGKVKTFALGSQPVPGITSIAAPGHTPGHSFYAIESKGQKLLFCGDVIHAGAVQFADPAVTIDFDVDLAGAEVARRKVFDEAVRSGYWMAAPHLSFPGLGHIRRVGKEYEWLPVNYATIFAGK